VLADLCGDQNDPLERALTPLWASVAQLHKGCRPGEPAGVGLVGWGGADGTEEVAVGWMVTAAGVGAVIYDPLVARA
jgi:hypothetical protein